MLYCMTNNALRISFKYMFQSKFLKIKNFFSSFWLKKTSNSVKKASIKTNKTRQAFTLTVLMFVSISYFKQALAYLPNYHFGILYISSLPILKLMTRGTTEPVLISYLQITIFLHSQTLRLTFIWGCFKWKMDVPQLVYDRSLKQVSSFHVSGCWAFVAPD